MKEFEFLYCVFSVDRRIVIKIPPKRSFSDVNNLLCMKRQPSPLLLTHPCSHILFCLVELSGGRPQDWALGSWASDLGSCNISLLNFILAMHECAQVLVEHGPPKGCETAVKPRVEKMRPAECSAEQTQAPNLLPPVSNILLPDRGKSAT